DDDQAARYRAADAVLSAAGRPWYEISNWARPGRECRHNLLYWAQGEYLGIGCAAHGHMPVGRRWWNVRTPDRYIALGDQGGTVARGAALGVSSATVRNEMAVLEREGYVTHPHTSAGRVPTDKGYRHFVDHLARQKELQPGARQEVASFFATAHHALEDMLHETSLLLSRITTHAAVVVGPQPDAARVRSVRLVRLHESSVLVVAVLSNGQVERQCL